MKAVIFANQNGYGLQKDTEVLLSVLEGHDVTVTPASREVKGRFDVAFHVEHLMARNLSCAAMNIAVPNPEWLSRAMGHTLRRCDMAIAKTQDCHRILTEHFPSVKTYFTGWTTPDVHTNEPRERSIVHVAGMSPLKSTLAVVQALEALKLPATVYHGRITALQPPNVTFIRKRVERLPRTFSIYVQPSQYEGYGHALNEAAACGAALVTTDADPMNMFDGRYLVPTTGYHLQGYANIYHLDPTELRRQIARAWETAPLFDQDQRDAYLRRDAAFRNAFKQLPIWN